MIYRTFYYRIG